MLLVALAFSLIAAACGQKGPLYLPGRSSTFESMTPEQRPEAENAAEEDSDDEESQQRPDTVN